MITIDVDTSLRLLREVVTEFGGRTVYVIPAAYDTCVYADKGECSCLVGHVLVRAGVSVDVLDGEEGPITGLVLEGIEVTDTARWVLAAAQEAQDIGETWGEALKRAEEAAAEYADLESTS